MNPFEPHFTPAELRLLALTPMELMRLALDAGDPHSAGATFEDLERRFKGGIRGYLIWEQATLEDLAGLPEARAEASVFATQGAWLIGGLNGITPDDLAIAGRDNQEEVQALAEESPEQALEAYRRIEEAYRKLHDAHRDAVAALWSILDTTAGRPALESCLRRLAELTLLRWMERDITESPHRRLRKWSALLTANFGAVTIEELEDRFRIVQDPCGTCTRQLTDGRYESPLNLPSVPSWVPDHGPSDLVPIYRAHVGLMHWLMPLERIGHPWPVITCPLRMGTGPCQIDVLKDPYGSP
jgi:hypothetical protein